MEDVEVLQEDFLLEAVGEPCWYPKMAIMDQDGGVHVRRPCPDYSLDLHPGVRLVEGKLAEGELGESQPSLEDPGEQAAARVHRVARGCRQVEAE